MTEVLNNWIMVHYAQDRKKNAHGNVPSHLTTFFSKWHYLLPYCIGGSSSRSDVSWSPGVGA